MRTLEKIGIVDDDPIVIFGIKLLIRQLGVALETEVWNNGEQALNGLVELSEKGESMPGIILLDLTMPIMDGWDFLEAFQKASLPNKGAVEINVLSSSINPVDKERALQYEIVRNYFVKPLNESSLREILGAGA